MNRLTIPALILLTLSSHFIVIASEEPDDYPDHGQLTTRMVKITESYPEYTKLESLVRTQGGKDIWVLSIGSGDLSSVPAIAVVGGTEGDHLLGTELALRFAEKLLENSGKSGGSGELLSGHTFYVFPDVNPDARAQYFAPLKYERKGNANSGYTDRFGNKTGHPYSDLNGDGMITHMRVKDSAGEWKEHPEDERLLVRVSRSEGEKGEYRLYREGVDFMKEERWSEEGVHFNKNFSFNYPVFTSGAGEHAVSEKESGAVAQFLFDAKNIYAVVSFGPANNLSQPLKFNEREASGRIITGILEDDAAFNQLVSKRYNEVTDSLMTGGYPGSDGDFFQWAYFHYGRYSFSTPGWEVPSVEHGGSTVKKSSGTDIDKKLSFLRWAEKENIDNVFVPWEKVSHPLYPDLDIEVGGIAPFVMDNPPFNMVEPIAGDHYRFIVDLSAMKPAVEIVNVKTEELGERLYRISADIANTGIFPTVSRLGERLKWVQKTVIRLETGSDQEVLSGRTVEVLSAIEGGRSEARSWLIRGEGELSLKAGAENTGFDERIIKL